MYWYCCWWLKSCTTWDVWNHVNNGINYLSTGAGFQPSTVSLLFWRTKRSPCPVFFKSMTRNLENFPALDLCTQTQSCFIWIHHTFPNQLVTSPTRPFHWGCPFWITFGFPQSYLLLRNYISVYIYTYTPFKSFSFRTFQESQVYIFGRSILSWTIAKWACKLGT